MIVGENKFSIEKIIIHMVFILLSIGFIVPLLAIVSISLSSESDIANYGYRLFPRVVDFSAYKITFINPGTILSAYKVTAIISVSGLAIYLAIASMCAYSISRTDFKYRKFITFYMFFTMLFGGGLVPYYILMTKYLNLRNTYWALIIPLLGNVWYIFLMRTFFQQLPTSVVESAKIDGAGELRIYAQIVLPLSTPVLATVGLLQILSNWNAWFYALLFIDKQNLIPLQYLLQVMLRNMQEVIANMDKMPMSVTANNEIPLESVRMAMCIIAIGPMLLVFPFFQKYFVKGLTVGSVKG